MKLNVNNKTILLLVIVAVAVGAVIMRKKSLHKTAEKKGPKIGILQFVSHPALNNARDGFMKQLEKSCNGNVEFVVQNAEGSMVMNQSLAQRLHNDSSLDGIFAIATPSAQAIHALEHKRPIFIAAITDPHAAGLIQPGGNVCGSSDMIDVPHLISVLCALAPKAQRIGILFNASEVNAATLAARMRTELAARDKEILEVGLNDGADVALAVKVACGKVDALIAPTDNTVASSIQAITQITRAARIPLIVSDNLLVPQGTLAASGVDYSQSGQTAALCAVAVLLDGKLPADLPIKKPVCEQVVVNETVLEELGLTVPESLKESVTLVK